MAYRPFRRLSERSSGAGWRGCLPGCDAVLIPVLADGMPLAASVPEMLESDQAGFFAFTAPLNASGSPAVTLPCGFTASGRPAGFQLVGPHCSEPVLLRAAHAFQQVTDWHLRRPTLD